MKRNIRRGPYSGPFNLSFTSDMQIFNTSVSDPSITKLTKNIGTSGIRTHADNVPTKSTVYHEQRLRPLGHRAM